MFQDLDSTLLALLQAELPPWLPAALGASRVSVSFDVPSAMTSAGAALPAVNLFLYEIDENRDLRATDAVLQRLSHGTVSSTPAPVRLDCHYLVTAWAQSINQEHLLLGEATRILLRYPELPAATLRGANMVAQPVAPRTNLLQATKQQSRGDFWSIFGGQPKAAVHFSVTICADVQAPEIAGGVVVETLVAPPLAASGTK